MKTAMQELITHLEMLKSRVDMVDIDSIIEYATNSLEKEKEQIIEAVEFGLFNMHTTIDGKYYYDLKFNQNK